MSVLFNPYWARFPEQGGRMGRMAVGYGELEIQFTACAGYAFGNLDLVLQTVYAVTGESNRLKVAHSLAGASFIELGLGNDYADIFGILRFCLKLRHQYSHSQFGDGTDGEVIFASMDDAFKNNLFQPQWKKLTKDLLREQEAYFQYAREFLEWLEGEARNRRDRVLDKRRPYPILHKKPSRIEQPLLHTD